MELLADRDPEDARELLDPILEHMMEAVHRYEGTVNQVMGDGIMAVFGAPIASCEVFAFSGTGVNVFTPPINAQSPVLQTLTPQSGAIGTHVTIKGTGFSTTQADNTVKFNGILAPVQT